MSLQESKDIPSTEPFLNKASDETDSLLQRYNVPAGLAGLGTDIYIHVIHSMTDPEDLQQFLLSTRAVSSVIRNSFFPWAQSPAAAQKYSINTIPVHKIDIVCKQCCSSDICLCSIERVFVARSPSLSCHSGGRQIQFALIIACILFHNSL